MLKKTSIAFLFEHELPRIIHEFSEINFLTMAKKISMYRVMKAVKAVYHVDDKAIIRTIATEYYNNFKAA